jgi:hypothetical protein
MDVLESGSPFVGGVGAGNTDVADIQVLGQYGDRIS